MIHADWSDLNRFHARLDSTNQRAHADVSRAVRKTAHDIAATAQTFVPVDTGATKSSIHVVEVAGYGGQGMAWDVGPTTHYAPFLEYGTVRAPAQPFMGPALDRHTPDLTKALRQIGEIR